MNDAALVAVLMRDRASVAARGDFDLQCPLLPRLRPYRPPADTVEKCHKRTFNWPPGGL